MISSIKNLISLPKEFQVEDLDSVEASLAHREIILSKPLLKKIYVNWYQMLLSEFDTDSKVLEIGAGGGFIKEIFPNVITSDIKEMPNCDRQVNALDIPFENESLDGIIMTNVFHHIPDCEKFLQEAERTLKKKGKIVMIEPANCFFSRLIYKNFHHEPFETEQKEWKFESKGPLSDSNQALPYIVFERDREIFETKFKNLKLKKIDYHTPLSYLISGGLSMKSLMPSFLNTMLLSVDKLFGFKGFCMFCTIEVEKV